MARSYESRSVGNKAPCGNTEKGTTHFLTQAGSRNYFQWRTLKSHETANCTVKISTGFDDFDTGFKVLRPRDDSADAEAESRKIHEQVIGKKVKRAVSISLDES